MTNQGRNAIDTLLAESLKELTIKQPIEKITIKEITDKAGVIRPTFYNHFQDKYELLEWIIRTELLEPVKPLIQNGMIDQALIIIFAGIEKEKDYKRADCPVSCPVLMFSGNYLDKKWNVYACKRDVGYL